MTWFKKRRPRLPLLILLRRSATAKLISKTTKVRVTRATHRAITTVIRAAAEGSGVAGKNLNRFQAQQK